MYEELLPKEFERESLKKKEDWRQEFITDKYVNMKYTSQENKERIQQESKFINVTTFTSWASFLLGKGRRFKKSTPSSLFLIRTLLFPHSSSVYPTLTLLHLPHLYSLILSLSSSHSPSPSPAQGKQLAQKVSCVLGCQLEVLKTSLHLPPPLNSQLYQRTERL